MLFAGPLFAGLHSAVVILCSSSLECVRSSNLTDVLNIFEHPFLQVSNQGLHTLGLPVVETFGVMCAEWCGSNHRVVEKSKDPVTAETPSGVTHSGMSSMAAHFFGGCGIFLQCFLVFCTLRLQYILAVFYFVGNYCCQPESYSLWALHEEDKGPDLTRAFSFSPPKNSRG